MKQAIIFILFLSNLAFTQVINTRILDANNVSALISDEGDFFQDQSLGVAHYEIPKGSGKNVIYNMSPWFGARDVNEVPQVVGDTYQGLHLRSGPIADQAAYSDPNYQNQYTESIWSVTAAEIDYHILHFMDPGYTAVPDITYWPGNGNTTLGVSQFLAPFIDINSNGVYEPLSGDYPDIKGDQAVYTIMHDYPANGQGTPMRIEIHVMAYQFIAGNYLGNTTFLNFKVYNRSNMDYHDFRQAIYMDPDIGYYSDDYVGCDSVLNVAYAYNGDAYDEDDGGNMGYHEYPPCVGLVSLNHEMDYFCYYTNAVAYPYTDPMNVGEMWYYMNGMWANGDPWVDINNNQTNYQFPGFPGDSTGFNELTIGNPPGDRRFVMTFAEDQFPIGAEICSDYAIVFDNSEMDPAQNVQNVLNIATSLQNLYDSSSDFPCSPGTMGVSEKEITDPDLRIYPNPSKGKFIIEPGDLTGVSHIKIYDLSGRVVLNNDFELKDQIEIELDTEPGVYIIRIVTATGEFLKKIVLE